MDPLQLTDGSPAWLQELLSLLPDSDMLEEKALIISLVILMYECGFYLENCSPNTTRVFNVKLMKDLPSLISLVKNEGRFKFTFNLHDSSHSVHLVITPLGSILIVNLLVPNVKVISVTLSINQFILKNASTASLINNQQLSIMFKNHIHSIKSLMLDETYNCHHIFGLPVEIVSYICEHLSPVEFVNFGKTCKQANAFLDYDIIWKSLAKLYFPSRKTPLDKSWKKFVVYQFKIEKGFRRGCEMAFSIYGPVI